METQLQFTSVLHLQDVHVIKVAADWKAMNHQSVYGPPGDI